MSRSVELWVGKTDDAKVPPRVIEQRLMSRVEFDTNGGCWLWSGAHCPDGYGHMKVGPRFEKAHRLSYRIHKGTIPTGAQVCHSCDQPACINPHHLWIGTPRDNIRDCIAKGRFQTGTSRGEANGSAKLSDADVAVIRAAPKFYGSGKALAARFGVREATISEIRHRTSRRGA